MKMSSNYQYVPRWMNVLIKWKLLLVLVLPCILNSVNSTHITGDFNTRDFFKFLLKFGFQKSETPQTQYGYIFGNITTQFDYIAPVTLAVLDKDAFIDFYNNRSYQRYGREHACQRMFAKLQQIAYDADCNPTNKIDYLRRVPCPKDQLCIDEDAPANVIAGNQFTYVISEGGQARFWYVALVACYRNRTTCQWHAYDPHNTATPFSLHDNDDDDDASAGKHHLHYDIHVVNVHPNSSAAHPLTYEFSFDQQNLLEMYLFFTLIYMVLLPLQIYAVLLQRHPVTRLFTLGLLSEFISLTLITVHLSKFALNGIGIPSLQTAGDILDIFSRTTFMLILLLLAKGWAVTRQQISRTGCIILLTIWVPYVAFNVFLYIWDRTEVDIIYDGDDYQTWPGWLILVLRTIIMMWFLYELRNTMKYEHSTKKLDFLLHLGASSLVWFIYLPIMAIVALQVNPMWREKLLLGITNGADCLAYCIMTGLLWPHRAGQYLLLAGNKYAGMDELDEFNEAPHIVRERELNRNSENTEKMVNGAIITTTTTTTTSTTNMTASDKINAQIPMHSINNEACIDLLQDDELDIDLLTDLNKYSHVVA